MIEVEISIAVTAYLSTQSLDCVNWNYFCHSDLSFCVCEFVSFLSFCRDLCFNTEDTEVTEFFSESLSAFSVLSVFFVFVRTVHV